MKFGAVILDMDGVLWRGSEQIGNLQRIFYNLAQAEIQVVLATNNSTKTPLQYVEKLSHFGVAVTEYQVVTSSQVASDYLKLNYPDKKHVYVIGEDGLRSAMIGNGFLIEETDAFAVVAGMDHEFDYRKLSIANTLIRSGALFIGTNNDLTFPTPEGLAPGAGSIIAAIQASSGNPPLIMGKPESEIFNICFNRLNTEPANTLVVGDRLETDIAGGQKAGCPTALVLSGVTRKEDVEAWKPSVNYVFQDLETLVEKLISNDEYQKH